MQDSLFANFGEYYFLVYWFYVHHLVFLPFRYFDTALCQYLFFRLSLVGLSNLSCLIFRFSICRINETPVRYIKLKLRGETTKFLSNPWLP